MYIYIYMFSKHSPARARAPDIRIAHISVADRVLCAARLSHATHTYVPVQMMITAGVSMLCAQ